MQMIFLRVCKKWGSCDGRNVGRQNEWRIYLGIFLPPDKRNNCANSLRCCFCLWLAILTGRHLNVAVRYDHNHPHRPHAHPMLYHSATQGVWLTRLIKAARKERNTGEWRKLMKLQLMQWVLFALFVPFLFCWSYQFALCCWGSQSASRFCYFRQFIVTSQGETHRIYRQTTK